MNELFLLKELQEIFYKDPRPNNFITVDQMRSKKSKYGRNQKCPCGSGLKYKKCCLKKEGP